MSSGWNKEFKIWTDGSAWTNGQAGCAFVWRAGTDLFGAYESLEVLTSAKPAEAHGILKAVRFHRDAAGRGGPGVRCGYLTIISDCQRVLRDIDDRRAYQDNYRGTSIDDIVECVEEMEEEFGTIVHFEWQPRNSTEEMTRADGWAKDGASLSWEQGGGIEVLKYTNASLSDH